MANQPGNGALYMQGIAVPASAMNSALFMQKTRRNTQLEVQRTFAGLGNQDIIELKKTDILSGLTLKFFGNLNVAPGTGSVNSTMRWPHDLARRVRFTANGQSNIINVSGAKLKVREIMKRGDLSDRGITQSINGTNVNQGTLAKACDAWGVGAGATAIAGGNYGVEIEWHLPIAEDEVDLAGAIFAQTSSTDLTVTIDWANTSDVFTLAGNAAVTLTGTLQVVATRFTIPGDGNGGIIVPDLRTFHSMIESRYSSIANGDNEVRLVGQGAGKNLLRLYHQVWNGTVPAPLVVNRTNFSQLAWRFAGNETPEVADGSFWRYWNERDYNADIGAQFGFFCFDFASENAFRDAVDLGATSEFRSLISIPSGVTLTTPAVEIVAETIFTAGVAA